MGLVACYVTPHPPIVVSAVGRERVAEVRGTADAMTALGREAGVLAPDTIVLLSPHAPLDPRHVSVCVAGHYTGSLAVFGAAQVAVSLEADAAMAEAIVCEAESAGLPVLRRGRPGSVVELDHGAVVPLSFLLGEMRRPPRFVELGFSFVPSETHLAFGQALARAVEASGRRVVFVASSDLSHRLIPDAPAGYTPRGREFDASVEAAFAAGDERALLAIPPELIDAAGECGYRSLLVLFGALRGRSYATRVLSYEGPFGVGYLVGAVDMREDAEAPGGSRSVCEADGADGERS
jgi:aromatic ring-opening dioxygenase LigB subunit